MADLGNTEFNDTLGNYSLAVGGLTLEMMQGVDYVGFPQVTVNYSAFVAETLALAESINGVAVTHYAEALSERVFVAEYADETFTGTPASGQSNYAHALLETVDLSEAASSIAPTHFAEAVDERVFVAEYTDETSYTGAGPGTAAFSHALVESVPLTDDVDALSPNHYAENVSEPVFLFTFITSGSTGEINAVPPTIGNFVPAVGTTLTPSSTIQFDTTDDSGLRRVVIIATYGDGTWDVVHDGDAFSPKYAGLSTRVGIVGGYRFVVLPSGGWRGAPTLRIIAGDLTGNETA